ncbi:MAG TPA: flagellar biosynthesis anti-sigma factor FlgM [Candidatus Ozemobacteraceae bacterium]|nr:flagellar biosynthesis anti-sigma factor FlgM [Candidatus Ozemobacteraceae bacterium]
MVDSIKGPGGKTIIVTHSKPKDAAEKPKEGSFDKALKSKSPSESASTPRAANLPETQPATLLNQAKLLHMQRLEEITRQIHDGTYKLVDPAVLADRLLEVMTDKKTREKFLRKFLNDEAELARAKGKPLSELDLKKLIFMVKGSADEQFDDPELEALLKELS